MQKFILTILLFIGCTTSVWAVTSTLPVDASGNIGVGTTAPAAALHVGGGGTAPASMPITGADLYVKGNIEFDGKIYGDGSYLSNVSATEADTLDTVTARGATTVNAVSIGTTIVGGGLTTTGNVGVGTSVPSSLLEVGIQKFNVTSTGCVGIGSINPGYSLTVQGTGATTTSVAQIRRSNDTYGPYQYYIKGRSAAGAQVDDLTGGSLYGILNSNNVIHTGAFIGGKAENVTAGAEAYGIAIWTSTGGTGFSTSNPPRVSINSLGNVGIGSTVPAGKFDLVDTSNTGAAFTLANNTATTIGNGVNTLGVLDLQSTSLTTGNFLNMELNAITSGKGINLTSTSTAFTGDLANFTASGSNAAVTGSVLKVGLTGANATGTALNVTTGATSGFALRVNDDGTYTDTSSFVVTADGNVGVGTSAPVALFDVTQKMVIQSSGNVGIGTTRPATVFHVSGIDSTGADNAVPQLLFENRSTSATGYVGALNRTRIGTGYLGGFPEIWIEATNVNNEGITKVRTVSNHGMAFYTNDAERGRITNAGNWGIGTTAALARLQVGAGTNTVAGSPPLGSNDALITGNLVVDGKIYGDGSQLTSLPAGGAAGSTTQVQYNNAGSLAGATGLVYDANGNVGIGTTAPAGGLQVLNIMKLDSTTKRLYLANNGLGDIDNFANAPLNIFGTTNSNGFIVAPYKDSGNLVNSPYFAFRSYNTAGTLKDMNFQTVITGADTYRFDVSDTDGLVRFSVMNAGNVGIGTTVPAGKMEVSGQYFSRRYAATASINWANGNAQYFQLSSGNNNITFTGAQPGGRYLLELKQPSSGAVGTVTWDANVKWPANTAPDLTDTNSQTDIITFFYNGTNYAGAASLDYAL